MAKVRMDSVKVRRANSSNNNKPSKPRKPQKPEATAAQMTFFEHLGELRTRLIWSSLAIIVCTAVAWYFHKELAAAYFDLAREPIERIAGAGKPKPEFVNLALVSGFTLYFEVALYAGLLLASPVLVYHILAFLAPALEPESQPGEVGHDEEVRLLKSVRRSVVFFIPLVAVFFLAGIAFAYYLVLPRAVDFLLAFGADQFRATLDVKPYIGTMSRIMFWSGLVFELPIIMFLLAKLRVVNWKKMAGFWKYALVLSLVAAAFITPSPDILSTAIISGPVFGLYWLGVLFARFA